MPGQPKVLAKIVRRGEIERGLVQELKTVCDGDLDIERMVSRVSMDPTVPNLEEKGGVFPDKRHDDEI